MNEERDPFAGAKPARPPAWLRARTLAATREALAAGPAPGDPWVRIATSRPIRIAWAAAVIVLAAAHLGISSRRPGASWPPVVGPSLAADADSDVVELVRMRAIDSQLELGPDLEVPEPSEEDGS